MSPSLSERLKAAYQGFKSPDSLRPLPEPSVVLLSPEAPQEPRTRYALNRLRKENKIYRHLESVLRGQILPTDYARIRALENPAHQAVIFHVMNVFPGSLFEALPFDLQPDDALKLAAEQILRWSWFGTQKDDLVDTSATLGDAFIRSRASETRVAMQVRDPDDISEFEEDGEGNIIYLRLDVELRDENGQPEFYTEAWSKEENVYAQWTHKQGLDADYSQLPAPEVEKRITDFGYDFVPYVRAPFEWGYRASERCMGVFELHGEAIDEILRNATVLRDRYFLHGEPDYQSITEQDKPVEYQELLDNDAQSSGKSNEVEDPEEGRMPSGSKLIRNPKGTRLETMVPNVNYQAGLDQIEDSRLALERSMSELRFFRGHDKGDPSGVAMDKHQDPAIRRARAARGNFEEAILKALKMCLTMGQRRKLFGTEIGTYEGGQFDALAFKPRPIVPLTEAEQTAADTAKAEMYAALKDVSPELLRLRLLDDGYSEEQATAIVNSQSRQSDLMRELTGGL